MQNTLRSHRVSDYFHVTMSDNLKLRAQDEHARDVIPYKTFRYIRTSTFDLELGICAKVDSELLQKNFELVKKVSFLEGGDAYDDRVLWRTTAHVPWYQYPHIRNINETKDLLRRKEA